MGSSRKKRWKSSFGRLALQRIPGEHVLLDGLPADQVLLYNSLDDFRRGRAIPGSIGVDDGDGTLLADAQAIRLGAVDTVGTGQEAQLRQAALQIFPRFETHFFGGALGLGLVAAQQDVAADVADLQALRDLNEALDLHASIVARTSGSGTK